MKTPFFDSLIDDFGIWHHSDGHNIMADEGYALDDAARGLLVCLALNKVKQAETLFEYLQKSRHKNGCYGFATKDRRFIKYPASADAAGQVAWAMGYAYSVGFHAKEAKETVLSLAPTILNHKHVRGYAYAILGALYVDKGLAKKLVQKLTRAFKAGTDEWLWPEPIMTYGNGIIPYAYLRYGLIIDDDAISKFGLKILEFVQKMCQHNRLPSPIGYEGWLPQNAMVVPQYSQQPIDAAYMVWAWLAAYQCFGQNKYHNMAKEWAAWFEGRNINAGRLYDPKTLKCFDGIDKEGINYHSGAESNICLLLTFYMMQHEDTI